MCYESWGFSGARKDLSTTRLMWSYLMQYPQQEVFSSHDYDLSTSGVLDNS